MKRFIGLTVFGIIVIVFVASLFLPNIPNGPEYVSDNNSESLSTDVLNMQLSLTSSAFGERESIPAKYTCDGDDISPPLKISGVPEETESLVLIMDDPDIPDFVKDKMGIDVFDHWVVFNISPELEEIFEGQEPDGVLGRNSRGSTGYIGACPPDREHRYFFKLYALDRMLDLEERATKKDVEEQMKGHILSKVELVGLYERNQ